MCDILNVHLNKLSQTASFSSPSYAVFSFLWVLFGIAPSSDAVKVAQRDRGRRPLQYIYPGESRKTSERFRTQPITTSERQETDRYRFGCSDAWPCGAKYVIMHVGEIGIVD